MTYYDCCYKRTLSFIKQQPASVYKICKLFYLLESKKKVSPMI